MDDSNVIGVFGVLFITATLIVWMITALCNTENEINFPQKYNMKNDSEAHSSNPINSIA